MNSANLDEQPIQDFMTSEVHTISKNASVCEAARVLVEHGISGLPVVDEMGKCVGVLSNSDLVRRWLNHSNDECGDDFVVAREGPEKTLHIEPADDDLVGHHMSTAVQTVPADRAVVEAAKYMVTADIHRLIVVDLDGRPVGVLSASDVLKMLVTLER